MANSETILPRHLTQLGEVLAPVLARFATAPAHTAYAPAIHDFDALMALLDRMQVYTTRVSEEVGRLAAEVVGNSHADAQTVYRTAGRFEAVLDDWRRLDADAGAVWLPGDDDEIRPLLQGALRHIHGDIRHWLADLVALLAEPQAALRKRGLPSTGKVTVDLVLTLSAPPQLAELSEKLEVLSLSYALMGRAPVAAPAARSGAGFWNTVFAATLGVGIGNALFGDNDE